MGDSHMDPDDENEMAHASTTIDFATWVGACTARDITVSGKPRKQRARKPFLYPGNIGGQSVPHRWQPTSTRPWDLPRVGHRGAQRQRVLHVGITTTWLLPRRDNTWNESPLVSGERRPRTWPTNLRQRS